MDQYPDEDELFDLRCQEELILKDLAPGLKGTNNIGNDSNSRVSNIALSQEPSTSRGIRALQDFPSPQISQINYLEDTVDGKRCHVGPVNRRLFETHLGVQRGSSTPFSNKTDFMAPQEVDMAGAESVPITAAVEVLQNIGMRSKRCLEKDLFGDIDDINMESSYVDPVAKRARPEEQRDIGMRNKRRLEKDLFGDIDDIDMASSYVDPIAKKARSEEQRDMDMINQILDTRKKMRESANRQKDDNLSRLNVLHAFKMRNLSYTQPQWPFLLLLRNDNERVHVRWHSDEYENRAIEDINVFSKGYSGLLGESKEHIWAVANEIISEKTSLAKSPKSAAAQIDVMEQQTDESLLWVEKYKPKKYIDLLSDETTNRSLLYWLKMWDKVVFGCLPKNNENSTTKRSNFNKKIGRFESNGGWNQYRRRQDLNTDVDGFGRPIQKVALLCGPPGLGKTTLAHIIARHAGYQVREINASDDRSPDAFKLALENGTQMKSVLSDEKRPNCIILDEIDGAPKQSIDFLIKFVTDNVVKKAKKKGAKSQRSILKRPIICICNDVYEPALRQLRQIAFVVTFPPIESARMAERLMQIARKEKLRTDFGALITLAEKSGNDVRSCISTMQFFNAQKKALTLHDVLSSSLGQKDRRQGLFDVWGAVFRIKRPQKQLEKSATEEESQVTMTDMSVESRVRNVLHVVHSGGDYERLTQGVYENYLHQKMPDPNLNGVVEASHWFCFSDSLHHQIGQLQNYSVYPYLQYGFVVWHLLFASLALPKINFPTRGFEFHQKNATHNLIFQAFRKGISSGAVGVGQGRVVLTETVPILKRILSPQLRSVAVQLLSPREQKDLRNTVEIMCDFGLTYTQVNKGDGHFNFQMEPDLDALTQFPGCPEISLNYSGRQLIAREVELEQMRRAMPRDRGYSKNHTPSTSGTHSNDKRPVPNHLQILKPKQIPPVAAVSKDFFGRLQRKKPIAEGSKSDPIVKSPIWYHFKQGFNNAVRKDVQVNELL